MRDSLQKVDASIRRRQFIASSVALSACVSLNATAQSNRFRIGLTPVILADQAAFLLRWSRYLSRRTQCDVSFVARESYQGVLDLLFAGQLDAAWLCGYPFVRHEAQLQLLSVPLYEGRPLYQAYLIRSRLSPEVNGWADLKNKVLAFADPLSNSGWLVAQNQLSLHGLHPRELKKTFFAHGHRSVAEAVAAQLAHAGAIDGYVWETMRLQGMAAIEQTQVVWKSDWFGFPPLVTRTGTVHAKTQAMQQTLLSMSADAEGLQLLKALNLSGFEAGKPSLYSSIRDLARVTTTRVV